MKKSLLSLFLLAIATMLNAQNHIQTQVPIRPAGQTDVIGLTVPKMKVVRIGIVGLGMRGPGAVYRLSNIEGTEIVALCDVEPNRVEAAQEILKKNNRKPAASYSGSAEAYKKMCERNDIDLVYICTDWVHHTPIALYAMEHGKNTAIEVPAATSMEEIWALINTSERTRKHCMMLENCVYDFFEISSLSMAQKGLFGDILHVEGSYLHNLDDVWPQYWNNWRLDFNEKHRGDLYPTHGIGPDCQVLNIHRGDRMDYLVAMDTKSVNGPKHVKRLTGKDSERFASGDETSTLIHTALDRTMLIEHDVMTPRPYSRMYQIVGSEGYASKYPVEQLCFRKETLEQFEGRQLEGVSTHSALPASLQQELLRKYTPQFVKDIEEKAKAVGGHGGMDYIMDYRLIYCLRNGLPLDMDVYDLAEWCCISELSRLSIENGSMPVDIPDFTRGAWNKVKGFTWKFAE
ncbi:MAG: Gfo/Idh/MocA family oxidoreductase [Prevotella sp.]|nr:Gfo/Idh/MocA family oxidoreductase [Prevotella sp.]MBQ6161723.1 Gfo/Idh/MocA family oxidoreductase [Prevotella sp.]MBQ6187740.1 Gfo/Idh/MocA family oxidoreductase [Prevotella sp.]